MYKTYLKKNMYGEKYVVASLFSLINIKRIPSLKNRDDNKYTNDIEYKNC